MKLDEDRIFETVEKIKNGTESKGALKELLGGKKLDDMFDQRTQEALFDNIINNRKIHNMVQNGNGIDTLEGLLNNKVNGNLADFYMIKPDYILQLSPKEQKNMADSISGGRQDLSLTLQNLWSRGIRTEACTTKSSDNIPMLQLNIKENDLANQDIIQQLYGQRDIQGNAFYDYQAKEFKINLEGNNLYNYLQGHNIPTLQTDKTNIFEGAVRDSLQNAEEIYNYYARNGMDTLEIREEILSERKSLLDISSRNKNLEGNAKNQNQIIRQEYYENGETNLPVRQNRFSRFLSQVRSRFARGKTDSIPIKNQQEQLSKSNSQERKSWELEPEEKAKIQRETAEIAKKHREQQEQQTQQTQVQEQNQEQANPQMIQGQVPQQPVMDMGGMEL